MTNSIAKLQNQDEKLQILYQEFIRVKCIKSFKFFCERITKECMTSKEFNLNQQWISLISDTIQDCFDQYESLVSKQIDDMCSRYIFNLPPRTGKSTIITILGAVYFLIRNPNKKVAVISSAKSTSEEWSTIIRNIAKSQFFQNVFNIFVFINNVKKIQLTNGGSITFLTSGTNEIGKGYDLVLFDDYLNPNYLKSVARMQTAQQNLNTFLGRKEYPITLTFFVEQRTGLNDITSSCIERWKKADVQYKQIVLPYEFIDDIIIEKYLFRGGTYLDVKFNDKDKRSIMANRNDDVNTSVWETQYQQNPQSRDNIIIDTKDFMPYLNQDLFYLRFVELFMVIDIAYGGKRTELNDFSAILTFAITEDGKLYILDIERTKKHFADFSNILTNKYNQFQKIRTLQNKLSLSMSNILVENQSLGYSDILKKEKGLPMYIIERKGESKVKRVDMANRYIKEKKVYIPIENAFTLDFKLECENFAIDMSHRHDDMVDCLADAINHVLAKTNINNSFSGFSIIDHND